MRLHLYMYTQQSSPLPVNLCLSIGNKQVPLAREIIQSSNGPRYLSTIPLKDSHLFKIAELVISFWFKKFSNSAISNRWKSFSEMVDYVTYSSWKSYNFSISSLLPLGLFLHQHVIHEPYICMPSIRTTCQPRMLIF